MDPYGGSNPSSPRLDNTIPQQPAPQAPAFQSTDFSGQPVTAPGLPGPQPQSPMMPDPMAPQMGQLPTAPPAMPSNIDGMSELGLSSEPSGPIGGKGKIVLLIAGASILFIGLMVGVFFIGNTSGKSQGRKESDIAYQKKAADLQRQQAENTTNTDTAQLDLGSDLIEPKYVDENVEGDVGKQLAASDGLIVKVTNIERNFKTTDPNYKLDSSKELVKVNFLMGNVAKDKAKDITSAGAFYLLNSANARLTPESIASYTDKFDTVKLDPGAQTKGAIVYLVNKDEKPLKFVREQSYRFSGENRQVTTKITVNITD